MPFPAARNGRELGSTGSVLAANGPCPRVTIGKPAVTLDIIRNFSLVGASPTAIDGGDGRRNHLKECAGLLRRPDRWANGKPNAPPVPRPSASASELKQGRIAVIGTNRDLELLLRSLDREFATLSRLARRAPDQTWISYRLVALRRHRSAISATLANRRLEAAKPVVDLTRWFHGNGELDAIGDRVAPLRAEPPTLIA
jgi:hypothetical protein